MSKSHRKRFTAPAHLLMNPDVQPMLKRLGLNVSDERAANVSRIEVVCSVADVVLAGKARA